MATFGEKVRACRIMKEMGSRQLDRACAELSGKKWCGRVWQIEAGRIPDPRLSTVLVLARALEVAPSMLLPSSE
jgi:transcriptional regulator with XRE-family HTH domain